MRAVTLGMYPPINGKYSKDLVQVIKMMLQQKAKMRPSSEKLFTSSLVQKKIEELHIESQKDEDSVKS